MCCFMTRSHAMLCTAWTKVSYGKVEDKGPSEKWFGRQTHCDAYTIQPTSGRVVVEVCNATRRAHCDAYTATHTTFQHSTAAVQVVVVLLGVVGVIVLVVVVVVVVVVGWYDATVDTAEWWSRGSQNWADPDHGLHSTLCQSMMMMVSVMMLMMTMVTMMMMMIV